MTTPPKSSPKKTSNAVASRVGRTANTVNSRATNVHSQAFPFSSLVPVSSMFNCSCVGSSAANNSYDGRKAAVTWFCILTASAGQHGCPNSVPRNSGVRMLRTGWQRGVLRGQSRFCFEFRDPIKQRFHKDANGRSHLGFEFRRNRVWTWLRGRHYACRPKKLRSCPDQFIEKLAPGCEQLPAQTTTI